MLLRRPRQWNLLQVVMPAWFRAAYVGAHLPWTVLLNIKPYAKKLAAPAGQFSTLEDSACIQKVGPAELSLVQAVRHLFGGRVAKEELLWLLPGQAGR